MVIKYRFCRPLAQQLTAGLLASALLGSAGACAQEHKLVPADQIINSLSPQLTRSLNAPQQPQMSTADRAFLQSLHSRTRSLTIGDGERFDEIKEKVHLANTDIEITFGFNSATITRAAEAQLNELGKALSSSKLDSSFFMVSGYTDAKGRPDYNQVLSVRRAEAVKRYLTTRFQITAMDLGTVGYGKRHLKNPADPFGAENRRVQIVNAGANVARR